MQSDWSLRDELQTINQRWLIILLWVLIGSLVGWFIARLFPGPYQATNQLYVGLNPYRALRDMNIPVHPESANDYKNWQMEDLKTVMRSQPILDQTLAKLQKEDAYWQTINTTQLAEMLEVYWRNAGTWNLVAEHRQAKYARQAVRAWEAVVLAGVRAAVAQSQEVFALDTRLQALATEQAALIARQAELEKSLAEFSGSDSEKQALQSNVETIQAQMTALAAQQSELEAQYAKASQASLGLSANLVVDSLSDDAPEVRRLRSSGTLILVGGLFGLFTWIGWWLVRITYFKPGSTPSARSLKP